MDENEFKFFISTCKSMYVTKYSVELHTTKFILHTHFVTAQADR